MTNAHPLPPSPRTSRNPTTVSSSTSNNPIALFSLPSPPVQSPILLPSGITIATPQTRAQVTALRRITTLLLPIPYPDRFYTDILADPVINTLTRIALTPEGKVIGGVRCRLEYPTSSTAHSTISSPQPPPPSSAGPASDANTTTTGAPTLYIQTLTLLSPHRGRGIATALLAEVTATAVRVRGAASVYAHVWEANTDGLEWYVRRGFTVEGAVLQGYYSQLRPGGARVVRRRVGVGEMVRIKERGLDGQREEDN